MKVNLSEQLNIAPTELVFSVVTPSYSVSEEHTASIFRGEVNVITQIYTRRGGDGNLSKPTEIGEQERRKKTLLKDPSINVA
jgi:hypothetical protein